MSASKRRVKKALRNLWVLELRIKNGFPVPEDELKAAMQNVLVQRTRQNFWQVPNK